MDGKISVLMCTYKEPVLYVEKALQSILNQSFQPFEIIIIVDCPTNYDVIDYLKEKSINNPIIKIYINEQNIGLVKSLNWGIKKCNGDYIARMDADDISLYNRFELQLCFLKKQNLDLIGTNFFLINQNGEVISRIKNPCNPSDCKKMLKKNNCIAHPTWFGKKEVFEKLNGYREISTCEDYDFLIRAAEYGFRLGNCQQELFLYRYNNNGISRTMSSKQNVTTYYLRKMYKKNCVPTIKQYDDFISSDEFSRKVAREEEYLYYKNVIKKGKGISRINALFHLIYKYNFWLVDFPRLLKKVK